MPRLKTALRPARRGLRRFVTAPVLLTLEDRCLLAGGWSGYASNPQHTADTSVPAQPLQAIHWQTTIDPTSKNSGGEIFAHYGSPLVTDANTVIVPVTTASGSYEVEAFQGSDGTSLWTLPSDYTPPAHDWVPEFSPVLATIPGPTPIARLYVPAADGTVEYIDNPDDPSATVTGRFAFYGVSNYNTDVALGDANIQICTPITADASGNIYFGFRVAGQNAAGLANGIAKIAPDGVGTSVSVASLGLNVTVGGVAIEPITQVAMNCAPALSNDESTLYIGVQGGSGYGDLLQLTTADLSYVASVTLLDPAGTQHGGQPSVIHDDSSASPTVGPDGDVFYGVLENTFASNHDRGWLLHFSGDLSQTKDAGFFGWDDTASVVPASMVPSYTGTSPYLLMTKYNDYADPGLGGTGVNQIAVIDPFTRDPDCPPGMNMMNVVLSIAGPTPDPTLRDANHPDAVREWCINSAAVDINPATHSVYANSEDGTLYRWDLASPGTFTQQVALTSGIGEAYTPTVVGPDGTVYAINDATLFAVGASSTSPSAPFAVGGDPSVNPAAFRVTTFASGLNYPTGMLTLSDSSLLVGVSNPKPGFNDYFDSTGELLRFSDPDGDGVADGPPTVLYNGLPGALTAVQQAGRYILVTSTENPLERISVLLTGATPDAPLTLVGSIDFSFSAVWDHSTYSLAVRPTPGDPGGSDVFFNIGSEFNGVAYDDNGNVILDANGNPTYQPSVDSVPASGLLDATLIPDSIYKVTLDDDNGTPVFSNLQQVASGVRNAASMAFDPTSGDLYFADNGIDGNNYGEEGWSTDVLDRIPAAQIGNGVENFGFPYTYTKTNAEPGQPVTVVNPGGGLPSLIAFEPLADPNLPVQGSRSQGASGFALSPPAFPAGLNDGVFIGFHGQFIQGGIANDKNPLVFANPTTGNYFDFISNDLPNIGHLDGAVSTNDLLFLSDMSSNGDIVTTAGIGQGVIYQIKAIPPTIDLNWSGGGVTAPASVDNASPVALPRTYTISGGALSGPLTIAYYISPSGVYGSADNQLLGTETITDPAALAAGTHAGTSPPLSFPALGTFTVLAVLDPANTVPELDKSNNVTAATQAVTVTGTQVIDNGQAGYSESPTNYWYTSGAAGGYGGSNRATAPGDGTHTAAWQFGGLAAGSYTVEATWLAGGGLGDNVPYRVYQGSTLLATARVNQKLDPQGADQAGGVTFQALATVTLAAGGGPLQVVVGNDADGYVEADAVRVVSS